MMPGSSGTPRMNYLSEHDMIDEQTRSSQQTCSTAHAPKSRAWMPIAALRLRSCAEPRPNDLQNASMYPAPWSHLTTLDCLKLGDSFQVNACHILPRPILEHAWTCVSSNCSDAISIRPLQQLQGVLHTVWPDPILVWLVADRRCRCRPAALLSVLQAPEPL